ncbi:MFS transporter [Ascoidea rubescens DSM 1968]|uniref:MFS general substrate transporter n=1 Tax=Ascoidea rubescens DSM 1968 TaxID=1344418 RepID=A0A1D2VFF4_9ASCO|nr:MFS general substrate transporter [Ascoidea rubescens DSM 1968]ODV60355.1 MFS general substrate transporter [Ascoidea rubescens DSM 1968]
MSYSQTDSLTTKDSPKAQIPTKSSFSDSEFDQESNDNDFINYLNSSNFANNNDTITRQLTLEEIGNEVKLERTKSLAITPSEGYLNELRNNEEDPKLIDPSTLDWEGADDPDNPNNWPSWKKWYSTMTVACICLVVTFGSSLFVCGVPELMVELNISQELCLAGLTFYLIGLAFGPILAAPISELFGRKIVYLFSLPMSMLFTMGVGLSNNIQSILVLRFFSGFFSSPAMAVAGGTICDIWEVQMQGVAMGTFCLAPFLGPVLGPVIGGFVAEKKGWKWTLWVNLMAAGLILIPVILLPESYKPILLKKRAKKRGYILKKPDVTLGQFLKIIIGVCLVKPIQMLFVEPIVMVFSIYIAFVFSVLFGFFEAFPIIYRGVYQMSFGVSGLAFLGIGIGLGLGTVYFIYVDRFVYWKKNPDGTRGQFDENGNPVFPEPESRLDLCKVGAIILPPSLFWLGWTARESVHYMVSIAAGLPFGFSMILIFFSNISYFALSYPPLSVASALAANNLLRYSLASVFPLFTVQMYDKLGIDWASSLFGFIALLMLPVPWVFAKWGPNLRKTSRFGYAAMKAFIYDFRTT